MRCFLPIPVVLIHHVLNCINSRTNTENYHMCLCSRCSYTVLLLSPCNENHMNLIHQTIIDVSDTDHHYTPIQYQHSCLCYLRYAYNQLLDACLPLVYVFLISQKQTNEQKTKLDALHGAWHNNIHCILFHSLLNEIVRSQIDCEISKRLFWVYEKGSAAVY